MKTLITLITILACCSLLRNPLYAQEKSGGSQRAHAVYGEFLGSGLIFSAPSGIIATPGKTNYLKKERGVDIFYSLPFIPSVPNGFIFNHRTP